MFKYNTVVFISKILQVKSVVIFGLGNLKCPLNTDKCFFPFNFLVSSSITPWGAQQLWDSSSNKPKTLALESQWTSQKNLRVWSSCLKRLIELLTGCKRHHELPWVIVTFFDDAATVLVLNRKPKIDKMCLKPIYSKYKDSLENRTGALCRISWVDKKRFRRLRNDVATLDSLLNACLLEPGSNSWVLVITPLIDYHLTVKFLKGLSFFKGTVNWAFDVQRSFSNCHWYTKCYNESSETEIIM